jgi:uncharacterized protein
MNFQQRYGRWCIVAGASEGLGAAFAEELASRGFNLVIVARRSELLQEFGAHLSQKYGVKIKPIVQDLSAPDAAEQIVQQTMNLDIGLLIYNAAFSAVGPFLDRSMDDHLREIHTNIHAPFKLVYLLGQRMLERGRGGIVLMSSLSAFQGSAYISNYAATKAFNIVLAEGLWEEWRTQGVDILVCISGAMKTPNYVASEPRRTGRFFDSTMEPAQVVHEALEALGAQPYVIAGSMNRFASFIMRRLLPRKMAIQLMGKVLRDMYVK